MLSVKEAECVGFESRWTVKKVQTISSSQTEEISKKEASSITFDKRTQETQTEEPKFSTEVKYDSDRLASFLNRIYPKLKQELDDNNSSYAFQGYYPFDEPCFAKAKLLQTIPVIVERENGKDIPRVSTISWSSTGNTLAVACDYPHKTWCYHEGQIAFYTFDRNDKLPDIPNKKIKTATCVKVVRFHPKLPYIVAGGTYTGDVYIWSIQQESTDTALLKVSAHEDVITDIDWIGEVNKVDEVSLATSSTDGYINIWNFDINLPVLKLKRRYKIKSSLFNKPFETSDISTDLSQKINRGIMSFSFSCHMPETFVVAAEGGLVVECSVLGAKKLKGSTEKIPILDPTVSFYEFHKDEITSIRFSPNQKDQFMTNSLDGEVRIYLLGQESPARVIFPNKALATISWIPYYEKLIVGCGSSGFEVYNVINREKLNNIVDQKAEELPSTELELNRIRVTTMAVGTNSGLIQLWSIPWGSLGNVK